MRILNLFVLATTLNLVTPAQAATPAEVAKVLKLVDDPTNPGFKKNRQGTRIVFVSGPLRYTFYHLLKDGPGKPMNRLLIYASVRKTAEKQEGNVFGDDGYDGTVDYGGGYTIPKDESKPLPDLKDFDVRENKGEEHRGIYQEMYDQAIRAALRLLKPKSK